MSETWTSLLAALVGAIVGGAASLAGTMLVNKQQIATNARMRLYDELLPELASAVTETSLRDGKSYPQVREVLPAVRRASAIAGRKERSAAHILALHWSAIEGVSENFEGSMQSPTAVSADPPDPPGKKPAPGSFGGRRAIREELRRQMEEEIRALSDYLGMKLV